jgi:hypothetical protein
MAYDVANPPICAAAGIGSAPSLWVYIDTDAHGTACDGTTGYFTDGAARGIKANDVMIVVDSDTYTCTVHMMKSATVGAAATLA